MGQVLEFQSRMVEAGDCIVCGIQIVLPQQFYRHRLKDHKSFHCVNGHIQQFCGETEEEKLRKIVAQKDERIALERKWREEAERKTSAARGQITKIKNRVGNGVCPCCNRTFQNLMQHMSTQHPDFKEAT